MLGKWLLGFVVNSETSGLSLFKAGTIVVQ